MNVRAHMCDSMCVCICVCIYIVGKLFMLHRQRYCVYTSMSYFVYAGMVEDGHVPESVSCNALLQACGDMAAAQGLLSQGLDCVCVCVCVRACMRYVYLRTYIHAYMLIHTYSNRCRHIHTHTYTHAVYTHTCVNAYSCNYIRPMCVHCQAKKQTCVLRNAHSTHNSESLYTYTRVFIHIYIHLYTKQTSVSGTTFRTENTKRVHT
jgi:hypothetical protein